MRIHPIVLTIVLLGMGQTAYAHTGFHPVEGWLSGFVHPLMGLDHLLAMLGVGIFAVSASEDKGQVWWPPVVFVSFMVVGGMMGAAGFQFLGVEQGIAVSVLVLGLMIAGTVRLPAYLANALIGCFALFHGISHGAEMGQDTDLIGYSLGFISATALLHLTGIILGYRVLPAASRFRTMGFAIGGIGFYLMYQSI